MIFQSNTRYIVMIIATIIIVYASITKSKKQQKLETFYSQISDSDMVKYNNDTKKTLDTIESTLKNILGTSKLDTAISSKIDPITAKISQISTEFKKNNQSITTGSGVPTYDKLKCGDVYNRTVPVFSGGTNLGGIKKIVDFLGTKRPSSKDPNNKESLIVFGLNSYQKTMDMLCNALKAKNKVNKETDNDEIKSEQCDAHKYGNDKC
jgi:hypothetical protein